MELKRNSNQADSTLITLGDLIIGKDFFIIAGPCAVESESQTLQIARLVKSSGARFLRGGAYKPRTSPTSFQGLGMDGLKILEKARQETGLFIVTEVLDPRDVSWVCEYADVLQIGTRNMQNYSLLKEVGKIKKPVLLKRGMQATLHEWLQSAAYVLDGGNLSVILCERGIRTTETYTRNTLDLSAVPALRELSPLPVVVDPSHATGRRSLIPPMALSAVVAGADGVMVEVHQDPNHALCDKEQALTPKEFADLARHLFSLQKFMAELRTTAHDTPSFVSSSQSGLVS